MSLPFAFSRVYVVLLTCFSSLRWDRTGHLLQIQYVKGSPLSGLDLRRARDSSADAVFVMSTELGHPALSEGFDMEAALACRSVKMSSPWTPVYCQVGTSQPRAYLHKGIAQAPQ